MMILISFISIIFCLITFLVIKNINKNVRHQGLNYFKNAFLYYAIGSFFRIPLVAYLIAGIVNLKYITIKFFFVFFMNLAGFNLIQSLFWRKIKNKDLYTNSVKVFISIIIATFDCLFSNTTIYSFYVQIIIFTLVSIVTYNNYSSEKNMNIKKKRFFYFISMLLILTAWVANYIGVVFLSKNKIFLLYSSLATTFVFIAIAINVIKNLGGKKDA